MKIDHAIFTNSKMFVKVGEKELFITGEYTAITSFLCWYQINETVGSTVWKWKAILSE